MNPHIAGCNCKFYCQILLGIPLLLSVTNSMAQEYDWYAGIGAGRSSADIRKNDIISSLQRDGYSISQFNRNDDDNAYKLFGGYQFNPHFALEAGYFDHGNFNFMSVLLQADIQGGETSVDGFSVDLVGKLPLDFGISAFARAGINNARVEQKFIDSLIGTGFTNRTERDINEKFGVGVEYAFNDIFTLRAELERYRIESNLMAGDSVDTFSVSLLYRFGSRRPARTAGTNTQMDRQPTQTISLSPTTSPAATPAPVVLPAEITLTASTLFDFDKSELKTEGKNILDGLVRDMADLNYEVVIVTGHTDRIGTRTYNLALSQRRAETVRSYLVQVGVPNQRITATGVNSDEPVTTPQQCSGPVSDTLKACLQPDRRVVVEVTGKLNSQ